jgi:cysteine-rich repeat protein
MREFTLSISNKSLVAVKLSLIAVILIGLVVFVSSVLPAFADESGAILWTTDSSGTDKTDFEPGDIVYIHGTGFNPTSQIGITVTRPDFTVEPCNADACNFRFLDGLQTSDGEGDFLYRYSLNGITGTYIVDASDGTISAQTSFTDSRTINSVKLNGSSSVTTPPSSPINVAVNVTTSSAGGTNNDWKSTRYAIEGESWQCKDTPDHTSSGTYVETFIITSPATPGIYDITFRAYDNDDCTGASPSANYTLINGITVTSPDVCGNGNSVPPELCDDGNTADCDGCKGDCTRYDDVCGDGIIECGEECDDANTNNNDGCDSSCVIENGWSCSGQPSVCTVDNPTLSSSCGIDIALIIDNSGSISSSELTAMKDAFKAFVDAFLPTTPTQMAVVSFNTLATLRLDYNSDGTTIKNAIDAVTTSSGYTNWQDALVVAHDQYDNRIDKPDLYVFASDGEPNRYGNPAVTATTPEAVARAVIEANQIKLDGIRIITLGIGTGGSQSFIDNLKAISSDDAYYDTDFNTLAQTLAALADDLCGGTITVKKLVDGNPATGWQFTTSVTGGTSNPTSSTTDGTGFINPVFDIDISDTTATVDLTETSQGGYGFVSAHCYKDQQEVGTPGQGTVTGIDIGKNDAIYCEFQNTAHECETNEDCNYLDYDCADGICNAQNQCEQQFKLDTYVCRSSAGECDLEEKCTGQSADCPIDAKSTDICRNVAGDCDVAEYCDGQNDYCPADSFLSDTTECRASGGVCDLAEFCTGLSADCPFDLKSTAECRPATDVCDVAENCDGINDVCPPDAKAPFSTPCDDGLWCSETDHCDGKGTCVQLTPRDCSNYDLPGIATCDNDPDINPFTWDYREAFTSQCNADLNICTEGDCAITHTCADSDSGDGGPIIPVGNEIRACSAQCDGFGTECQPYLSQDYCYYGGSCNTDPSSCICDYQNNQYCPIPGTVKDGICYYGTQSCTEKGCGLSTELMKCYDVCDPELGPKDTIGPTTSNLIVNPPVNNGIFDTTATVNDTCSNIKTAKYYIGHSSIGSCSESAAEQFGTIYPLDDNTFDLDKLIEYVGRASNYPRDGLNYICIEGQDVVNNWGNCACAYFESDTIPPDCPYDIYLDKQLNPNEYQICGNNAWLNATVCDQESWIQGGEYFIDTIIPPIPAPWSGIWMNVLKNFTDGRGYHCAILGAQVDASRLSDGTHYIKLRGKDAVENWGKISECPTVSFIGDTTEPKTTKTVGDPKHACEGQEECDYYITQNTEITLTCYDFNPDDNTNDGYNNLPGEYSNDVTIHWRYRVDDGSWQEFSYNGNEAKFKFPEDTTHELEYWCSDGCGNTEDKHYETDIVDTQKPTITKIIGDPKIACDPEDPSGCDYWVRDHVTPIDLYCSDSEPHPVDHVKLWYKILLDGGQVLQDWTDPIAEKHKQIIFNEDSVHTLQYYCEDELGNSEGTRENPHEQIYRVDSTPPETIKTLGTPFWNIDGKEWINSSTPITMTPTDGGQVCAIGVDKTWYKNILAGSGYYGDLGELACSDPENYCKVPEEYKYCQYCPDGKYPKDCIDVYQEDCEDLEVHGQVYSSWEECVQAESNQHCCGGWDWTLYTEPFQKPQESCHILYYFSVDELGNVEPIKVNCFYVENTPPVTTKIVGDPKVKIDCSLTGEGTFTDGCYYITQNTEITLECTDQQPHPVDNVKIYYKIDWKELSGDQWTEGQWTEDSNSVTFSYPKDSYHRLTWYCVDALGNAEQEHTELDIVDTQPPVSQKDLGDPKHECTVEEQAMYYPQMPDPTNGCYFITQQTPITLTCADQNPHPVDHVKIYYRDYLFYEPDFTAQVVDDGWIVVNDDHVTITKTEDSAHILEWYCVDELGNTETTHVEYDIVDTKAPEGIKTIGDPKIFDAKPEAYGPDEKPGIAGVDDDNDGKVDNIEELGSPGSDDVINPENVFYWVRDHVTQITLDCQDKQPHPVDHEKMCYRISFDDPETPWLTCDYCAEFGGTVEGEWCCLEKVSLPYTFTFEEDSLHDLEYYCNDTLGNENQPDIEYFKVDSTPPVTTKTYGQPLVETGGGYPKWINSSTPIILTAEDGGEVCAINDVKIYWMNTLVDDTYCQNVENCQPIHGYESEGWNEYIEPFYKPEESCHMIEYYSEDALGNKEPIKAQCVFVENTPPVTTKTVGDPKHACEGQEECDWYVTQDTEITLECTDLGNHPVDNVKIYYKIDWKELLEDEWTGGQWTEDSNHVTIKYNEDSYHRLSWYCVDALGNAEKERQEIDVVDTQKPTITKRVGDPKIKGTGNVDWWITQDTHIYLDCQDSIPHPVSDVTLYWRDYLDGKTPGQWNVETDGSADIKKDEDCLHVLEWYCEDALGNSEGTATNPIVEYDQVDTEPPMVEKFVVKDGERIYAPEEGVVTIAIGGGNIIKFCANVTDIKQTGDSGVGVETVFGRLAGLQDPEFELTWDEMEQAYCYEETMTEECGKWHYEVKAEDLLGNEGEWTDGIEILIDNVPPIGQVLNPHAGNNYYAGKIFSFYAPAVDFGGNDCDCCPLFYEGGECEGYDCPASGVDYCDVYAIDFNFEGLDQSKIKECWEDLWTYFGQFLVDPYIEYIGRVPYENGVCKGYLTIPEDTNLTDTVFMAIEWVDKAGNERFGLALNPWFSPITMNMEEKGFLTLVDYFDSPVTSNDLIRVEATLNESGLSGSKECVGIVEKYDETSMMYITSYQGDITGNAIDGYRCIITGSLPDYSEIDSGDYRFTVEYRLNDDWQVEVIGSDWFDFVVDNTRPTMGVVSPEENESYGELLPVSLHVEDESGIVDQTVKFRLQEIGTFGNLWCLGGCEDTGWITLTKQDNGLYADMINLTEHGIEGNGKYSFDAIACDILYQPDNDPDNKLGIDMQLDRNTVHCKQISLHGASHEVRPECDDGWDNDLDEHIDYPMDDGCFSHEDESEEALSVPAGSIIITELMIDPDKVNDEYGEYVELYNTGTETYDLYGLTLKDDGTNNHVISSSVSVDPGQHVVLCRNDDPIQNGGFNCDYEYGNFVLGNVEDEVILMQDGTLIDEVWYDDSWTIPTGFSINLDPYSYNSISNNNPLNWCESMTVFGLGDHGTPGSMNDYCPV